MINNQVCKIQVKEEYKQTVKENLDKLREIIQSQESPFSKGMIEDYRKQLTESLQDELANNKDLQDALNSIKMNNAQFAENLENNFMMILSKNLIQIQHLSITCLNKTL